MVVVLSLFSHWITPGPQKVKGGVLDAFDIRSCKCQFVQILEAAGGHGTVSEGGGGDSVGEDEERVRDGSEGRRAGRFTQLSR